MIVELLGREVNSALRRAGLDLRGPIIAPRWGAFVVMVDVTQAVGLGWEMIRRCGLKGRDNNRPGIWPNEAWKGGGAMPQSLSRILIHLIFSTKNRVPVLAPEIRAEVHPYLAAGLQENGCPSLQVGGTEDHVHLLFGLSRTWTVAQVVEEVKVSSSKWIKTKGPGFADFHWQAGYGAFSVSQSNAAAVVRYIQNQMEHHRKTTFQEEYQNFLRRHRVVYDDRYVWD